MDITVGSPRFPMFNLQKGKSYCFRVRSVIKFGVSESSEPSLPISLGQPQVHGLKSKKEYVFRVKSVGRAGNSTYSNESPPILVCNLDGGGQYYQFRVFAANVVGVGKPSEPSEAFLCEEWTMPEPGCPYDLEFREVRHNSLVVLWAVPLYEGQQGPITGYLVELSEGDQSQSWTAVNEKPIADTVFKVSGLQSGQTYRLRVCAFNKAGMGIPSLPSELIRAQTQPDTRDIEIGVDNDGFIFLAFEATEITEKSTFVWSKNYKEAIEATIGTAMSILTFTNATKEDLGLYTVEMSDNSDISSSFTFAAEDLERLTELGSDSPALQVAGGGVRGKGACVSGCRLRARATLQSSASFSTTERSLVLQPIKINFDKASGLIEILFDQLSKEDEGSYTAQLCDGRAKNQFTQVLVDERPYFLEFLSWTVTEDCEFIIKCKVTNVSKDTTLKWFKDGVETPAVYDQQTGVSTMTVQQVTKKEAGHCKAVASDGRGQDVSTLELLHEEYDKLLQLLSKQCALSAGPVRIQCTAVGFKLYCSLKYYISYMKTSWHFKESRIGQLERCKPGSSMQKLRVEVFAPTENDKGKYTLEMFDDQEKHTRSLGLSGQAFADALLKYQRLKQVTVAAKNRAKVTKGLPDVVAIMESKSLCLTCFADGDHAPEMFWLRNDKGIASGGPVQHRQRE
ncbi:myomesin-3-like [Salmo trutta]|uniref:myomesin-3-like n=1 Tax=Salmo trutta TaxID=8032 RepID=UPI001131CB1C|nr:myomesin-3-like [Salmo trutta]